MKDHQNTGSSPLHSGAVVEVDLRGDLDLDGTLLEQFEAELVSPPDRILQLGEILERLDAARRDGARAVLLLVDSLGGNAWAGLTLYDALRDLSESGVRVLAHVSGCAGSTAAVLVLGADVVTLEAGAVIHPHGLVITSRTCPPGRVREALQLLALDEWLNAGILASRTRASAEDIARWVAHPGEELSPGRAVAAGYADRIATLEEARELAAVLAAGAVDLPSRTPAEVAEDRQDGEAAAREVGMAVSSAFMTGSPPAYLAAHVVVRLARERGLQVSNADLYARGARHLRMGASVVLLYGKLPTAVKQSLGLLTSAKEIKRRHVVSGIRLFLRQGWEEVAKESGEFRHFDKSLDRDARELFTAMEAHALGDVGADLVQFRNAILRVSAAPMMLVQKTVNAVTWYGAREQALEEGHLDPVAYADSIVTMTQAGGGMKDLAGVQRGGEWQKIFTVMFSYRSVLYNQLTERVPGKTRWAKATELTARLFWLLLLPVVFEELMNGADDDGEGDLDDRLKDLVLRMTVTAASTVPMVGDLAESVSSGRGGRYAPWIDTLFRNAQVLHELAKGDDLEASDYRAVVDLVGMIIRLPTAALWNLGELTSKVLDGTFEEPVRDLTMRTPSHWK